MIEPVEQALQISLNAELFYRAEEICNILLEDNPRNEKYWETYRDLTLFNKHYEKSFKAIEMLESLKGVSIKSLLQKSAIQQEFNNVSDALLEWQVMGLDPNWCQENYTIYVVTVVI